MHFCIDLHSFPKMSTPPASSSSAVSSSSAANSAPTVTESDQWHQILEHIQQLKELCDDTNDNFQKTTEDIIRAMLLGDRNPVGLAMNIMRFRLELKGSHTKEKRGDIVLKLQQISTLVVDYLKGKMKRTEGILKQIEKDLKLGMNSANLSADAWNLDVLRRALVSEGDTDEDIAIKESYILCQQVMYESIQNLQVAIEAVSLDVAINYNPNKNF